MSAPTDREVAAVDRGINRRWAELALRDRHPDPIVAELENDRDRYYARGEYEYAEQAHARAREEASLLGRQRERQR